MIDERLLIFFVVLILTYIFDHKILPQIGLATVILIEIRFNTVMLTTVTELDAWYVFMFIVNLLYIAFMVFASPMENDMENVI